VTNARAAGGQFVLGVKAMPGLPYDGHTLSGQIAQVERLTGEKVARVYVDKGYRGHGLTKPEIHVTQSPGQRSPTVRRELRRRAAVEPVIGHTKSTACSNAIASPAPAAMRSTPSSSAPNITSASCSLG
jgi:IS5 family transposase